MKKHLHFSKTFTRYLLSYMFIFFLPFIVMLFIMNIYFIDLYKEEITYNSNNNLLKVKNAIEFQLNQLDNLSAQIAIEEEFTNFYISNQYQRLKTIQRLYNYNITNDFISEIIFYVKDPKIILSSQGEHSQDYLLSHLSNYDSWNKEEMMDALNNTKIKGFRPFEYMSTSDGQRMKHLTYIYPMFRGSNNPYATILFQVSQKDFTSTFKVSEEHYQSNIIILDWKNTIIYGSGDSDDLSNEVIHNIIETKDSSLIKSLENNNYIISYIQSDKNDWVYIQYTSVEKMFEKVQSVKQLIIIAAIAILLIGSIFVYYFMHLNYNPIKNLKKFLESSLSQVPQSVNEIEAVHQAIAQLQQNTNYLEDKISQNSHTIRKFLLLKLIKGQFLDKEEFNSKAKEYGIFLSKSCLTVIVIRINQDHKKPLYQTTSLIESIEQLLAPQIDCYGIENINKNRIMLVFQFNNDEINIFHKELKNLNQYLTNNYKLKNVIGVGCICERINELYRSYIEANSIINYSAEKNSSNILFYNELVDNTNIIYPNTEIENLKTTLLDYDIERFQTTIKFLISVIQKNKPNMFITICLCYDIINTLIKTSNDIDKSILDNQDYHKILEESPYLTIYDLTSIIHELESKISSSMNKKGYNLNQTLIEQIKDYINSNYKNYTFSLQTLSDNFNMTLSNISHYFKNHTGTTLTKYLNTLKITEAKNLLIETNYTLEEIAISMNYANTSSFIRKFKSEIGVTPGQYRKLHGNKY